ncbi:MAG: 50S ribosomal protein L6 [Candidatus Roizmanbacteria bacterium]|nr:MAG: 50S ribosomal protein L6 [Candidatus Roizmanbacteria bacterium]
MSKIGEKVIEIPSQVHVEIIGDEVQAKGKAGELSVKVPSELVIEKGDNTIKLKRKSENKKVKSLHGLYRNLIFNAVSGVDEPWKKQLEVMGTGFNVKMQGEDLVFKLGYSHPVVYKKVPGITFQVEGNNKVVVAGADKQLVGQVAHQIKVLRKPDVYKGKGIRFEGEKLRIKPGKKAKTA